MVLFAFAFIDEAASGIPTINTTAIEQSFATSHAEIALVLFVLPGVFAMIVEPVVFLYADRYPRAWFIRGGATVLAASAFAAALAPNPVVLSVAVSFAWVATGASVALAQATLVDRTPDQRGRTMARWTLLSSLGDFAGPIIVGGLALVGLGWRASYLVIGAALAVWAAITWATPFTDARGAGDDDEEAPGVLAALRDALHDRVLVAWLFGIALCDLLDEILVVFATIHVREHFGAGTLVQSAVVGAGMVGSTLGLVWLERLLGRHGETKLLVWFGSACAVAFVAWIVAPTAWASVVLMVPVGVFASPLYPLAAAQAFARRPEQSGTVLAAGHLFTPLGLALPWLVGLIADHAGTFVALGLLILQPLGLVALVAFTRSDGPRRS
ncbi:MAG: MFS transporter [Kofleriaceae bacterium]|nr:MFS transporter [Kofleriaceae bacterium]